MSEWIDISLPIRSGMVVWPGDREVSVERVMKMEDGDAFNLTECAFAAHTGTHIDAPRHFLPEGASVDAMPLDAMMGPARVVEIHDPESVRPPELPRDLRPGERVLFKTNNSRLNNSSQTFIETFVYVSAEAASVLAALPARMIGIDYLSVGGYRCDLAETHKILLGGGIWVLEGLDLSRVNPGRYELICLPLRLMGADGAPARAALRRL